MSETTFKRKLALPIAAATVIAGAGAGALSYAHVSSAATTSNDISPPQQHQFDPSHHGHKGGHAPLGGDGIVTAINGSTISMQEEADEGGASYTVDAAQATFSKNGQTGSIALITVGDKIFVKGTVTGTNVAATNVSVGHPGHHWGHDHDGDHHGHTGASDH